MKNSMKLFAGLILALCLMSYSMYAQQGKPGGGWGKATPEERATRLTEMMKENLKLTAAQEPKVAAINLKYAKKNEELRSIADTAQQRKTFNSTNKQRETEMKAVLTADQFKMYQKQMEEMKAHRGMGGGGHPGDKH